MVSAAYLAHLKAGGYLRKKLPNFLRSFIWRTRRDSNPQPADFEVLLDILQVFYVVVFAFYTTSYGGKTEETFLYFLWILLRSHHLTPEI